MSRVQKKIIRKTPDQLGYKDRGKMKWQGLILSDMSELLREHAKAEELKRVEAKEQMDEIEITQILHQAYATKRLVFIQTNILKDGYHYPDLHCTVEGFQEDKIYLRLENGDLKSCSIEEIRNVQIKI